MDELQAANLDMIKAFWIANPHIKSCEVVEDGRVPACGWYLRMGQTAYINPAKCSPNDSSYMPTSASIRRVVAHEVGHHVWYEISKLRLAFGTVKKIERSVSNYERGKVDEQFAETFALFLTNPALLKYGRPMRFATLTAFMAPIESREWQELVPSGSELFLENWRNNRHCS